MMQERWDDIRAIWHSSPVLYGIAGFLAGILFFPALEALSTNASDLLSGFVPEAVGIAFTVLLIDRFNRLRALEQYKQHLVRNAGSRSNDTALSAIDELRKRHWIEGENGLLKGAVLARANLRRAELVEANLENAQLAQVDLENAFLFGANLKGAVLLHASLKKADLSFAQFSEKTLLPDGYTFWKSYIDMSRFTDPNHPDFWEPDWVKKEREHKG